MADLIRQTTDRHDTVVAGNRRGAGTTRGLLGEPVFDKLHASGLGHAGGHQRRASVQLGLRWRTLLFGSEHNDPSTPANHRPSRTTRNHSRAASGRHRQQDDVLQVA
jgi:chorismate synthase